MNIHDVMEPTPAQNGQTRREFDIAKPMVTQTWQTSQRRYRVCEARDCAIPTSDGTKLNGYIFRPDAEGKFPLILGVCAYSLEDQVAPIMPVGAGGIRGHMEARDPNFYVSRGYVHAILNVRGTGKSEGFPVYATSPEIWID
ncbi:MAG TPA: CocE/NonD family hydrolase [Terriglobales bacterium]|nr:CocE/NonD family hydrolase [Terriglobales bacterium]